MAASLITSFNSLPSSPVFSFHFKIQNKFIQFPQSRSPPEFRFSDHFGCRKKRGLTAVTRAGPPSTSNFVIAFTLPLSLLIITVLVSLRIGDKLDKQFLEELAINEAMKEVDEEEDEEDEQNADIAVDEEAAIPAAPASRTRNRPIKEV